MRTLKRGNGATVNDSGSAASLILYSDGAKLATVNTTPNAIANVSVPLPVLNRGNVRRFVIFAASSFSTGSIRTR